ncbi:Mrna binding post-transcriptional regulator [Mycena venus]|uniref:Mrna binding post-transcriptional regulator n=1 Tax=Mycena venus TaxID=2733690 RepID=A0A8H6XVB4_9AGAR|nr:Mrna binding post-transcriptional regulator [Mycena venus]
MSSLRRIGALIRREAVCGAGPTRHIDGCIKGALKKQTLLLFQSHPQHAKRLALKSLTTSMTEYIPLKHLGKKISHQPAGTPFDPRPPQSNSLPLPHPQDRRVSGSGVTNSSAQTEAPGMTPQPELPPPSSTSASSKANSLDVIASTNEKSDANLPIARPNGAHGMAVNVNSGLSMGSSRGDMGVEGVYMAGGVNTSMPGGGENSQYPEEYSIVVSNLAPETSNEDLIAVFYDPSRCLGIGEPGPSKLMRPFTSCKTAKIVLDPMTGVSHGRVSFTDKEDQRRALVEMNGLCCRSQPMHISAATAEPNPPPSDLAPPLPAPPSSSDISPSSPVRTSRGSSSVTAASSVPTSIPNFYQTSRGQALLDDLRDLDLCLRAWNCLPVACVSTFGAIDRLQDLCMELEPLLKTDCVDQKTQARLAHLFQRIRDVGQDMTQSILGSDKLAPLYRRFYEQIEKGGDTGDTIRELQKLVHDESEKAKLRMAAYQRLIDYYNESGRNELHALLTASSKAARNAGLKADSSFSSKDENQMIYHTMEEVDSDLTTIGQAFKRSNEFWANMQRNFKTAPMPFVVANPHIPEPVAQKIHTDLQAIRGSVQKCRPPVEDFDAIVQCAADLSTNCAKVAQSQTSVQAHLQSAACNRKNAGKALKPLQKELESAVKVYQEMKEQFTKYKQTIYQMFWWGTNRSSEKIDPVAVAFIDSHKYPRYLLPFESAMEGIRREFAGMRGCELFFQKLTQMDLRRLGGIPQQ